MCTFINRETFFFNDDCPRTLGKVSEVFRGKKFDLGRIGVWLGAASNRRLNDKIKKERIRANLFYRLNGLPIDSRPLK